MDGGGLVQQAVEDGRGDRGFAKDATPVGIPCVARQDHAVTFIPGTHELKEDRGPTSFSGR
jgi:hypothetical protein